MNLRKLFFAFAVVGFVSSCQSTKTAPIGASGSPGSGSKAVVPTAPPLETAPTIKGTAAVLAHALTAVGDNRAPRFSPDGSKILFLSGARPSHKQTQVYELDLTRMTDRRITFHDGDDDGAAWAAGGQKIVYASSTDAMKEDVSMDRLKAVYDASKATGTAPNGIRALPKPAGSDIYLQRLDGREIERLTTNPASEYSPTADANAKDPKIVFVSDRDHSVLLYLYDSKSGQTRAITRTNGTSPAYSPDGKALVWQRAIDSGTEVARPYVTQLVMTTDLKNVTPLTAPGFFDHSPSWNAKGDTVIFASNRGGKIYDLYTIDRNGSCLKRLTQSKINLYFPSFSPDETKIAFSAKAGNQNQIYTMDNHASSMPCLVPVTLDAPAATATPAPTASPKP